MEQNNTAKREITADDVKKAAEAGITALNHEGTVLPANLRHDITLLEGMLRGIADGRLVVGTPIPE
jgi:hypothetical protein